MSFHCSIEFPVLQDKLFITLSLSLSVCYYSEMSASPASAKSLKSPANMPPPLGTPTRLQTLRNQSLKLHLPGSGRNYISLG